MCKALYIDDSQPSRDFSGVQLGMPDINSDPNLRPPLDREELAQSIEVDLDEEAVEEELTSFFEDYVAFANDAGEDVFDPETTLPLFLESEAGQAHVETFEDMAGEGQDSVST